MVDKLLGMLETFRPAFSRKASFELFRVIVLGFMIRDDNEGLSSFMRAFNIHGKHYGSLAHFFNADSYDKADLEKLWVKFLVRACNIAQLNDRYVLIGDHTKAPHSGRYMPGVEKQMDYSQNSAAAYIYAHIYGQVGLVIDTDSGLQCLPVLASIQNELGEIDNWLNYTEEVHRASNTVQMVKSLYTTAEALGTCLAILDRAFLSDNVLRKLDGLNKNTTIGGKNRLELVTRAKRGVVAYEAPQPNPRGRPPKRGTKHKLFDKFDNLDNSNVKFTTTTIVRPNGEKMDVEYYCINLFWGIELQRELRFVLTRCKLGDTVLVCTDLTMSPEDIILAYYYRWKIITIS